MDRPIAKQVELVVGRYERMVGQAWYARALQRYLGRLGVEYITTQTEYPLLIRAGQRVLKPLGYDLEAFFTTYPVKARLQKGTIKHLTVQQMASLFSFQEVESPVVITVHDIIPYMMRDDPELTDYHRFYDQWMDGLAVKNLLRADCIISVSEYTRKILIDAVGIAKEKIRVIHHGLDLDIFKPTTVSEELKAKYRIDMSYHYILYVGSEIPRKNLQRLLEAFAIVKRSNPDARFIKIGSPNQMRFYQKILDQIKELNLENEVILLKHVSREELISFYNLADVFVFPSLCEGFGIPPLEAMACGAPVICSNAASLPEVVGEAAISVDPLDVQGWADEMVRVMEDRDLRELLHTKSLRRASQFSWERMAEDTVAVYQEVANITQRASRLEQISPK